MRELTVRQRDLFALPTGAMQLPGRLTQPEADNSCATKTGQSDISMCYRHNKPDALAGGAGHGKVAKEWMTCGWNHGMIAGDGGMR
jgi:hypothetical protein